MKKIAILFSALVCAIFINAQENIQPIPLIGSTAPTFVASSTKGEITFPDDYGKSWKIIFSHPKDFTPVCSSELIELAKMQENFKELNTNIVVLSADLISQHQDWILALEEVLENNGTNSKIDFPLISDNTLYISHKYGMIHPDVNTDRDIRGVFIIDPDNIVRSIQFYPVEVGRNISEIERSLIALQTTAEHKNVLTPANWEPGNEILIPFLTKEEEKSLGEANSNIRQEAFFLTYKKLK